MIRTEKTKVEVNNLSGFVRKFGLEKRFKEKYGKPIEDWEEDCSGWDADEVYIEELLDEMEGEFYYSYLPIDEGYFVIIEFDR